MGFDLVERMRASANVVPADQMFPGDKWIERRQLLREAADYLEAQTALVAKLDKERADAPDMKIIAALMERLDAAAKACFDVTRTAYADGAGGSVITEEAHEACAAVVLFEMGRRSGSMMNIFALPEDGLSRACGPEDK